MVKVLSRFQWVKNIEKKLNEIGKTNSDQIRECKSAISEVGF